MKKTILMHILNFMNNYNLIYRLLFAIIITSTLLTFTNCDDTASILGNELLPDEDIVTVNMDSVRNINTYHLFWDDYRTGKVVSIDGVSNNSVYLGQLYHPSFGTTEASFVAQFLYDLDEKYFGENIEPDSLMIYLRINSSYGDKIDIGNLDVYRINHNFFKDSVEDDLIQLNTNIDLEPYYSESDRVSESAELKGDTMIAIKMSQSFMQEIAGIDSLTFTKADSFKNFLPGLYFKTNNIAQYGNLKRINLFNDTTTMTFYYTKNDTSSESVKFIVREYSDWVNKIETNYASSESEYFIETNDSLDNDSILFLKGLNGTLARFNFKNIEPYFNDDSAYAFYKAELIIYPSSTLNYSSVFDFPQKLNFYSKDDDNYILMKDDYIENSGVYLKDKGYYYFTITNFLQNMINDKEYETDYYVGINNHKGDPSMVALEAGNSMFIKIYYSKF